MRNLPTRLWIYTNRPEQEYTQYEPPYNGDRWNETIPYISLEEHEALLQESQAQSERLLDCMKKILSECGSLHKPIYFIWMKEAIAAHEKSQAGSGEEK